MMNRKSNRLIKKLTNCQLGDVAVSSITVAELRFGAAKSQSVERNNSALDEFLTPLEIINFNNRAANVYGCVRAGLEKIGKPIGPLDMLIAAQAMAEQLVLITNNSGEFSRVKGLAIENWI